MKKQNEELAIAIEKARLAEEALNISRDNFRHVSENIDAIIWSMDLKNDKWLYVSPAAEKILGYAPKEWINFRWWVENIHKDDQAWVRDFCANQTKLGKTHDFEYRLIHKNGNVVWVHDKVGVEIVDNEPAYLYGIMFDITERRQTEFKLKENEEFSRYLLQTIPFGIDIIDEDGNILYLSEGLKQKFGEDSSGKKCWELYRDDHKQCNNCPLHAGIKTGVTETLQSQGILGGKIFEVSHTGMIFNGKKALLEIFIDITERKQAEEALRKNEAKQLKMVSNIGDVIVIIDQNGINQYKSPNIKNLFGWEAEEVVGRSTWDLVHPDDLEYAKQFISSLTVQPNATGTTEIRYKCKDGNYVWIEITLVNLLSDPDVRGILGNYHDISERRLAEKLLNDFIDNNPMSIQIVDKEGLTLRGNPAYIKLFGSFPPPNFSIFAELQSQSETLEKLVLLAKSGNVVNLPDVYFNAHDIVPDAPDNPLWIRALIFPLMDNSGNAERFVFMHENITERKMAEQELIIAKDHAQQSDRLKSAFLANMSHEIRTPMNGILGFANLLKETGLTGEEQQKYITIIEKSGARMLNIINDIVDISKIEAGLMKVDIAESNINEQLEFIYTFFKPEVESKGMKFTFKNSLTAREATIKTDREKIYAILTNLVKNAIKYSNNGEIEIGYSLVETRGPIAETHGHASVLQFYVKDTGIGIPKNRQKAVFERFIQADIVDAHARQGAGLGLAITKSYVEMLGGKIWVESREGIGSTFYFTTPYNNEPEKEAAVINIDKYDSQGNKIDPKVSGLKILIVDDDETSEMLISIIMKEFSHEIIKARTGVEAIESCRNHPDIDLVLMDVQMPVLGGHEATREIRRFNKEVIIIAQTAYGLSGDREKAIESGCTDYISKPISKEELLALIQKYFNK